MLILLPLACSLAIPARLSMQVDSGTTPRLAIPVRRSCQMGHIKTIRLQSVHLRPESEVCAFTLPLVLFSSVSFQLRKSRLVCRRYLCLLRTDILLVIKEMIAGARAFQKLAAMAHPSPQSGQGTEFVKLLALSLEDVVIGRRLFSFFQLYASHRLKPKATPPPTWSLPTANSVIRFPQAGSGEFQHRRLPFTGQMLTK